MNDVLVLLALLLLAVVATTAALTRDPARQAVVIGVMGMVLALLFTLLQAPDVALSQLGVGTAITPLLILLTLRAVHKDRGQREARNARKRGERS